MGSGREKTDLDLASFADLAAQSRLLVVPFRPPRTPLPGKDTFIGRVCCGLEGCLHQWKYGEGASR